jgi:hypothetical protein
VITCSSRIPIPSSSLCVMSILRQSESGADGLHGGVGDPLLNQPAKFSSLSLNSRTGGVLSQLARPPEVVQRGLLTKGRIGTEIRSTLQYGCLQNAGARDSVRARWVALQAGGSILETSSARTLFFRRSL